MGFFARYVGVIVAGFLVLPASAAWAGGEHELPDPASVSAQTTPPREWAHDVCSATDEWIANIKQGSDLLASELGRAQGAPKARDVLTNYMGNFAQVTDTFLAQVREAGVPNMKNGNKLARAIQNGIRDDMNLFAGAQTTAINLDTTDPTKFAAAKRELGDIVARSGTKLGLTITRAERKYNSPTLDDPDCS